jgi:hypothetical protein
MNVSPVHKQTKHFVDVEFDQKDRDIVIESDQEDVEPIRLELVSEPSPYSYKNEVRVVKTETGYRVGYLEDSCFGYYGSDDAERELEERMNYHATVSA